jgi:DNA-binding NtrC family response regulator
MSIQLSGEFREPLVGDSVTHSGLDSGRRGSVLVVEADAHLRLAFSIVFGAAGCRVRVAPDALTALCEMQGELPEILVVDLDLPGADGCEFLVAVSRSFPSVKVIAVGGAFGGSIPTGVRADAFHEKGAHPTALIDMVKAMSGRTMKGPRRSAQATPCRDALRHADDEATFPAARRLRMALVS